MARVGVFICWCGANIAETVDSGAVARYAGTLPGVVVARDYKYMCSDPGQRLITDAIKEHRLSGVVVASCSPRMHETTFRRTVAGVGLNPYMFEMANIREHCSWVHHDRREATEKAKDLVRLMVMKVRRNAPLAEKSGVPLSRLYAVARFYHAFSLKPRGRNIIRVCLGTACHLRGGDHVADAITRELGIAHGETTKDLEFTFERVNCLGACALAPVVTVNNKYYGQMTASKMRQLIEQLASQPRRVEAPAEPVAAAV